MRELFDLGTTRIDAADVERIHQLDGQQQSEQGTVFSADETLQENRRCTIQWIKNDWLHDLLWSHVESANRSTFGFDVIERAEMQLVTYTADERGHYDWHHDVQWYSQTSYDRKLSLTIQLTESDAYDGGNFEFEEVQTNADFRSIGTVLIFPSYLRHRITPVTQGERKALVAWFYGPRWR